jgi:hypothetical protein
LGFDANGDLPRHVEAREAVVSSMVVIPCKRRIEDPGGVNVDLLFAYKDFIVVAKNFAFGSGICNYLSFAVLPPIARAQKRCRKQN